MYRKILTTWTGACYLNSLSGLQYKKYTFLQCLGLNYTALKRGQHCLCVTVRIPKMLDKEIQAWGLQNKQQFNTDVRYKYKCQIQIQMSDIT